MSQGVDCLICLPKTAWPRLVVLKKDADVKAINNGMKAAQIESFAYEEDPIVPCDDIGDTHGSVFDPGMTLEIAADSKKAFKVFT